MRILRAIATIAVVALILGIVWMLTSQTSSLLSIESWPVAVFYSTIALIITIKEFKKWFVVIPADPYTIGAPKFLGRRLGGYLEGKVFLPLGKGLIFDFETIVVEPKDFKWEFADILLDNSGAQNDKNETQRIIVTAEGQILPNEDDAWMWLENEGQWENRLRAIVEQAVRKQARDEHSEPHTWQEATKKPEPFVKAALESLVSNKNKPIKRVVSDDEVSNIRKGQGDIYLECIYANLKMLNIKATVPQSILDAETEKEVSRANMEKQREVNKARVEMVKEMSAAGIAPDVALLDQQVRNKEVSQTVTTNRSVMDVTKPFAETLEKVAAKGGQVVIMMGGGTTPPVLDKEGKKGGGK